MEFFPSPLCTALARSCDTSSFYILNCPIFLGGEDDDGGGVLVPGLLAALPRLLHPRQPLPSHQLQPLHTGQSALSTDQFPKVVAFFAISPPNHTNINNILAAHVFVSASFLPPHHK